MEHVVIVKEEASNLLEGAPLDNTDSTGTSSPIGETEKLSSRDNLVDLERLKKNKLSSTTFSSKTKPDSRNSGSHGQGRKQLRFSTTHSAAFASRKNPLRPKSIIKWPKGNMQYKVRFREVTKVSGEKKPIRRKKAYSHRSVDDLEFRRRWERALDRLAEREGPVKLNGCVIRGKP